jgi:uracil-DNA glycosylase
VIPPEWAALLPQGLAEPPLHAVAAERAAGMVIYPPAGRLFTALELTPPEAVKVVIIGQDPYHEAGQAMGLAFAVPPECPKLPPSLKNILREYADDLNLPLPIKPDLRKWAAQGVLMLNTVLSVREHAANSHAKIGWQRVTDALITAVNAHCTPSVFILWGAPAQSKLPLIDTQRHGVLCAPHPSPLSAYRGFFGSRPFSQANQWLSAHGREPIDWTL